MDVNNPLKMVLIGIDPYPSGRIIDKNQRFSILKVPAGLALQVTTMFSITKNSSMVFYGYPLSTGLMKHPNDVACNIIPNKGIPNI